MNDAGYITKEQLEKTLDSLCTEKSAEYISLSDVALRLHITPKYLSVVFKKKMGVNFKDYMQNLRLEKIALKLITTEDNIIDIAGNCGYTNIKQFYKRFYVKYGMTPGKFRRKMTNSPLGAFKTNIYGWVGLPDTWRITGRGYETVNVGHHAITICGVCLDGTKSFSFRIKGSFSGNSLGILFGIKEFDRDAIVSNTSALILDSVYKAGFMLVEKNAYASRLLSFNISGFENIHTLSIKYDCDENLLTGFIDGEIISKITVKPCNIVGNLGIIASLSDAVIYEAEFVQ